MIIILIHYIKNIIETKEEHYFYFLAALASILYVKDLYCALIINIFIAVALIDYRYGIIPNDLNFLTFIIGLFKLFYTKTLNKSLIIFIIILVLFLVSIIKDLIGMGDIKALFSLYVLFNQNEYSLFLSYLSFLTFLTSLYLLIFTNKKAMPLGPAMLFSVIFTLGC